MKLQLFPAPDEHVEDCPRSKDEGGHCQCWWESDECCWCGAGPESLLTIYRSCGLREALWMAWSRLMGTQ